LTSLNLTKKQKNWIELNYQTESSVFVKGFNKAFKRDLTRVQLRRYGKRQGWVTGQDGKFKQGDIPYNKDKKGLTSRNKTTFKKGNCPHNHTPIGTERLTTKDKYLKVKIAEPNVWIFKHRKVWQDNNGPLKKGQVLIFLDGNQMNCSISNIECVTRAELLSLKIGRAHV